MPGPLDRLGRGAEEPLADYLARHASSGAADEGSPTGHRPGGTAIGRKVAAAAESFTGAGALAVAGQSYRYDCSGLVEATLAKAGIPWEGSTAMLYDAAGAAGVLHHRHIPHVGDIAFFDNTYDRDGNGLLDDLRTHSAIVVGVDAEGTVDMVHLGSKGVVHLRMNLRHPHDRDVGGGEILNDYLRAKSGGDPPGTEYLAGELWAGFATFTEASNAED